MRVFQAMAVLALAAVTLAPASPAAPTGVNGLRQLAAVPLGTLSLRDLPTLGSGPQPQIDLELYQVLVYCALRHDESVTIDVGGEQVVLNGWLGFAPEWKDGDCSAESCQEWVTACMLGKINAWALPAQILYASNYEPHRGKADLADWPFEEGSFYGNMFADPPVAYTCRGRSLDVEPLMQVFRRCAADPEACGESVPVGECFDVDGDGRRACESFDDETGSFVRCHGVQSGSDGSFAPSDHAYRTITVRLRKSGLCE